MSPVLVDWRTGIDPFFEKVWGRVGSLGVEEIPGGGIVEREVSVAVETAGEEEGADFPRIRNHARFRKGLWLILLAGLQSQKWKENEGATHGGELREFRPQGQSR